MLCLTSTSAKTPAEINRLMHSGTWRCSKKARQTRGGGGEGLEKLSAQLNAKE